jgi:hypothetical protein
MLTQVLDGKFLQAPLVANARGGADVRVAVSLHSASASKVMRSSTPARLSGYDTILLWLAQDLQDMAPGLRQSIQEQNVVVHANATGPALGTWPRRSAPHPKCYDARSKMGQLSPHETEGAYTGWVWVVGSCGEYVAQEGGGNVGKFIGQCCDY